MRSVLGLAVLGLAVALTTALFATAAQDHAFGDPAGAHHSGRDVAPSVGAPCRAGTIAPPALHPSFAGRRTMPLATADHAPSVWGECDIGRAVFLMSKSVPTFHLPRSSCAGTRPVPCQLRSVSVVAGELSFVRARADPPTVRLCGYHRAQLAGVGALVLAPRNGEGNGRGAA